MDISLIIALALTMAAVVSLETGFSSAVLDVLAGAVLAFFLPEVLKVGWMDFLAHLGMLLLMFMAGFEVETDRLRREWRACLGVGSLSLMVPFLAIGALAHWGFGLNPLASALMAIGLSTTSLALVYQSLKEMNIASSHTGQTLIGAASVTDLLSMVFLAILLGDAGWGTALFILAAFTTLLGLPHVGAWAIRRYRGTMVEPEVRFPLVLFIGLGVLAKEVGGIHPTVVAFAVGVTVSGIVERHAVFKSKFVGLVFGFFAPLFFLNAGTRLDPGYLTPESWAIVLVLLVVAFASKYFATAFGVKTLFKSNGEKLAGLLFNHRLTFGIVAATVGLQAGVLSEMHYTVMLSTILLSSLVVGTVLRKRASKISKEAPAPQSGGQQIPEWEPGTL